MTVSAVVKPPNCALPVKVAATVPLTRHASVSRLVRNPREPDEIEDAGDGDERGRGGQAGAALRLSCSLRGPLASTPTLSTVSAPERMRKMSPASICLVE
jgi:hypothetical protein